MTDRSMMSATVLPLRQVHETTIAFAVELEKVESTSSMSSTVQLDAPNSLPLVRSVDEVGYDDLANDASQTLCVGAVGEVLLDVVVPVLLAGKLDNEGMRDAVLDASDGMNCKWTTNVPGDPQARCPCHP
jgi:hypothetical protein